MSMTRRALTTSFFTLLALCQATSPNAAPTSGQLCSAAKVTATAKALECLAGEQNKALFSKPADPTKCMTKLNAAFAKAEAKAGPACPTVADAVTAGILTIDIESELFSALMGSAAINKAQKTCVAAKNKALGKFASCQAKAFAKRLTATRPVESSSDFAKCYSVLGTAFGRQETRRGAECLTTSDATLWSTSNRAAAYLPGANLTGAFLFATRLAGATLENAILTEANLFSADAHGANLHGADLTGAEMTGTYLVDADLTDVTWNATTCFDGSNSLTNGSSPQSCCARFGASPPSACSP